MNSTDLYRLMRIPVRLLFSIALSICLIGWGYWITSRQASESLRESSRLANEMSQTPAPVYSLELLRTFRAVDSSTKSSVESSIASDIDTDQSMRNENLMTEPLSIQILFEGNSLFESTQPIEPQYPIFIEEIPGVRIGLNEVFFMARLRPTDDPFELHAMLGRVKLGDRVIAEKVYTNQANCSLVYGTLVFEGLAERNTDGLTVGRPEGIVTE